MRNTYLISLAFIVSIFAHASTGSKAFSTLMLVNNEWEIQPETAWIDFKFSDNFVKTPTNNIGFHLDQVIQLLKNRDMTSLSNSQQTKRQALLVELTKYKDAAVFPINNLTLYQTPIFIDEFRTYCAVGYLLKQSGAASLANEINATQRFAYIKEIKNKELLSWAFDNGFTVDELALIQPGYPPATQAASMQNGLDSTVYSITAFAPSQRLFAVGDFQNAIGGVGLNKAAEWINGFAGYSWIDPGVQSVQGALLASIIFQNKLVLGGNFKINGNPTAKNIAYFDLNTNSLQTLPPLDSTVRAFTIYNDTLYAGGDFNGGVVKWDGTNWLTLDNTFPISGQVRALSVWKNLLVIGGDFDIPTGAIRKNAIFYDGQYFTPAGFGTATPVNSFAIFKDKLYAACTFVQGIDTCALAVYDTFNQVWHTALKPSSSPFGAPLDGVSFNALLADKNELYVGGDFNTSTGMTFGNNIGMIVSDPSDSTKVYCSPVLSLSGPVYCLAKLNDYLYFGGDFRNTFGDTLNNIGYLDLGSTPTAIKDIDVASNIEIYPNPVTDYLHVNLKDNSIMNQVQVYTIDGQKVFTDVIANRKKRIGTANLSNGNYIIEVIAKGRKNISRFLKTE